MIIKILNEIELKEIKVYSKTAHAAVSKVTHAYSQILVGQLNAMWHAALLIRDSHLKYKLTELTTTHCNSVVFLRV